MKQKEIKVKNISYFFEEIARERFSVLENVTTTFAYKKITAIIGASSSGKTVLLKHLNGLLIPTSGEVHIDDYVIKANQKKIHNVNKIRKKIGFVFQFVQRQLFEETVEKDIIFGPLNFGFSKKNAKKNAKKYLKLLGLSESFLKRSPFELSGGQKSRVAIAGIFAYEPDFVIFDQLANGFDLSMKNNFLQLLVNLRNEYNKTIIFTSNDNNDVLKIADEVIVLDQGKLITKRPPMELFLDNVFCEKWKIKIPKTINFINLWKKYGFVADNLNFQDENKLITSVVDYFKKKN